ncbi:MAG: site-specific integrase [Nitrosopumilus sp.]|nr:site-specific integrase [Nitrosopumilus sp.]NRA05628.1 site-specific integrase [Nitrosopumilus sp.]
MIPRSILLFENSIKTKATRKLYNYALKKFIEYYKLKSIESILEIPDKKLQEMLEDYLFYFKAKNLKTPTIRSYFSAIELLCIVNDKNGINFKKIHKMFPPNVKKAGRDSYSTNDVQEMLNHAKELRTLVILHILASTGMRVGALPELKLRDLLDMPNECMALHIYEDSDEEYWGFLTPEASKIVKEYLDKRVKDGETSDSSNPLIRERYSIGIAKPRHISQPNIRVIIHRLLKITPLTRTKEGNRFSIMEAHGMRKRFNTILKLNKDISPASTEKLMGHKINLDSVYFTPTREELFDEFKKAIPELTVDNSTRKQFELDKVTKEKSDLENVNLVLKQTIIEKDEIAKKYRDVMIQPITDDTINEKIEYFLKKRKEL